MVLFEALPRIYILRVPQTTSVGAITFVVSHRDTSANLFLYPMHDITICFFFFNPSSHKGCATLLLCVSNFFQHLWVHFGSNRKS